MTLRFRQSIRIAPGIRLNISKTGVSASIGGQPLTLNISRKGLKGTASAPGTGLSFSKTASFAELKHDDSEVLIAPLPIEEAGEGSLTIQIALAVLILMAAVWGLVTYFSGRAPETATIQPPAAASAEPPPKVAPHQTKRQK